MHTHTHVPNQLGARARARQAFQHPEQGVPVRLRDGSEAVLRPLYAGEDVPLVAVFDQLSPDSRARRYLVGVPRLTQAMVDALVGVDGDDHVAWLASIGDRPVGIARYVRVGPVTAEIALEVADVYQRRGLGTALLDAVTTMACLNGFRQVEAFVLPGNRAPLNLLEKIGVSMKASGSVLEGRGPLRLLDPPTLDRTAVVALATRAVEDERAPAEPWPAAVNDGT